MMVGGSSSTCSEARIGRYHWLADQFKGIKDDQGKLLFRGAIIRDITQRKRDYDALEKLAQQHWLALDAAHMGWWHYDLATQVLSWDDRYREIFGMNGYQWPNDETMARSHPYDLPGAWAKMETALDPVNPHRILLGVASVFRMDAPGGSRPTELHPSGAKAAPGM